jgi:predicted secreted protein
MAAQRGKDLLLKMDENRDGSFVTVAGLRTRRIAFNAETVDITDAESASLRQVFFAGDIVPYQVAIPEFGTITGPFQLTALEYAGEHNGEITFEATLESAGALAFAAV